MLGDAATLNGRTREFFLSLLHYNPETGELSWKKKVRGKEAGDIAGHLDSKGYIGLHIRPHILYAHRVIWFMQTGAPPKGVIDHIDGNPSNNRWTNLRDSSYRQNSQNHKRHRTGKLVGASWRASANKWLASIRVAGKKKHLGFFLTEQEAHQAYCKATKELNGAEQ